VSRYFLIASLPAIALTQPPPIPRARLLEQAAEQLAPRDVVKVRAALEGVPSAAELRIRVACARQRAARWGQDPRGLPDPGLPRLLLEQEAAEALRAAHPLERERALDALRWRTIDDEFATAPFSAAAVAGYAGQLALAERWAARTAVRGTEIWNQTLERLLAEFDQRQGRSPA
jgi:hypothetical protein